MVYSSSLICVLNLVELVVSFSVPIAVLDVGPSRDSD